MGSIWVCVVVKNHHYTSFFWHIECEWSASCTWNRTYRDTTLLNLILKSSCAGCPVLNARCTVFILRNAVISIDYSVVWHEDGWMPCTNLRDTVKGQRLEKELGKPWHMCIYTPMCVCLITHHTQVYTQVCASMSNTICEVSSLGIPLLVVCLVSLHTVCHTRWLRKARLVEVGKPRTCHSCVFSSLWGARPSMAVVVDISDGYNSGRHTHTYIYIYMYI